jgi:hypothetical protein
MVEPHHERVAVFDGAGSAAGALPREEAKRSGLALGAVNLLLVMRHERPGLLGLGTR